MPVRNPSRRARIEALAATAEYNENEAANAQRMLDNMPRGLDTIATDIKAEWGRGIDSQFAVGRLLSEARQLMPADDAFGKWLKDQNFGFTTKTANNLRRGAERELEVRAFIAARKETSGTGKDIGVVYAMDLLAPSRVKPRITIPDGDIAPADPALVALREAHTVALSVVEGEPTVNGFLTMHVDDLAKCAGYIRDLANAYTEARTARG